MMMLALHISTYDYLDDFIVLIIGISDNWGNGGLTPLFKHIGSYGISRCVMFLYMT